MIKNDRHITLCADQLYYLLSTNLNAFSASVAFFGIYHRMEVLDLYCTERTDLNALHAAETADFAGFSCVYALVAVAAFYYGVGAYRLDSDKMLRADVGAFAAPMNL